MNVFVDSHPQPLSMFISQLWGSNWKVYTIYIYKCCLNFFSHQSYDAAVLPHLRQAEELSILQELALAGANGAYISGVENNVAIELCEKKLVCRLSIEGEGLENSTEIAGGGGWYTLSDHARQFATLAFRLSKPTKLLEFQRKGASAAASPADLTSVELVQRLSKKGWSDQTTSKPKKATPYCHGQPKLWFRKPGKSINVSYLRVLVQSDDILQTVEKIHHFQPKAYYSALLHGCSPLPDQPLAYYQKLMSNSKSKSRKRKTVEDATAELDQEEDIGN